jgi:hypothetical protein
LYKLGLDELFFIIHFFAKSLADSNSREIEENAIENKHKAKADEIYSIFFINKSYIIN